MYRARSNLWNCKLPECKNRNKRHDDLNELATHFGVEKGEIKKINKYLQTNLLREMKKENKSKQSDTGNCGFYSPKSFVIKH